VWATSAGTLIPVQPGRVVAVAVVLAAGLAACGGGGSDSAATSSTDATTTTTVAPTTTTSAAVTTLEVTTAPWSLPAPVSREVALTDGTALHVLGGQDAAHSSSAAVNRIDPATGVATSIGTLAPAVHDAAGVRLGADDVVIAGGSPPARATVQAFSGTGAARTIGQLPAPRTDHGTALIGTTVYVLGGADTAETPVGEVLASGDGVTWRAAGTLAEPVRYPALAVVGNAIYLFGGVGPAHHDSTSVQRYDPATGTTQVVAKLPAPLSHASAVVLGGSVFVLGGFVSDQPSTQILRFDPATAGVTTAGALAASLTDGAAVVIGDRGYLVGGEGPGRATTASVEILRAH